MTQMTVSRAWPLDFFYIEKEKYRARPRQKSIRKFGNWLGARFVITRNEFTVETSEICSDDLACVRMRLEKEQKEETIIHVFPSTLLDIVTSHRSYKFPYASARATARRSLVRSLARRRTSSSRGTIRLLSRYPRETLVPFADQKEARQKTRAERRYDLWAVRSSHLSATTQRPAIVRFRLMKLSSLLCARPSRRP